MQYRFEFRSSYMGETRFDLHVKGQPVRSIRLRYSFDDYERSISAPDARACAESSIGLLRECAGLEPLAPEIVEAFNAWRAADYAAALETIRANPVRYAGYEDYLPGPPVPVVAGRYNVATGLWERLPDMAQAA